MAKRKMKPATAIKVYLEKDSVRGKIKLKEEFVPFKAACENSEWRQMAMDAAEELGVELDLS